MQSALCPDEVRGRPRVKVYHLMLLSILALLLNIHNSHMSYDDRLTNVHNSGSPKSPRSTIVKKKKILRAFAFCSNCLSYFYISWNGKSKLILAIFFFLSSLWRKRTKSVSSLIWLNVVIYSVVINHNLTRRRVLFYETISTFIIWNSLICWCFLFQYMRFISGRDRITYDTTFECIVCLAIKKNWYL